MGEEDDADATKWTGDAEVEPEAGEVTATPAHDAAAKDRNAKRVLAANFIKTCTPFMKRLTSMNV